ncbi:MAG: hypothetical protein VKL42_12005 [Snowella sp.]|nr:hypothetical protein [Snowella sp.]
MKCDHPFPIPEKAIALSHQKKSRNLAAQYEKMTVGERITDMAM